MTDIMPFDFDAHNIRTVIKDGEPWFVGQDVAKALGYADPGGALRGLDAEDMFLHPLLDSRGVRQNTRLINESGLYALIFGSQLESAKKFKRWVTKVVLPTLRKAGEFSLRPTGEYKPIYGTKVIEAIKTSGKLAGEAYNDIYRAQGINEFLRIGLTKGSRYGGGGEYYKEGKRVYLWQRMNELELEQNKFLQGQIVAAYNLLKDDPKALQEYFETLSIDKMITAR